MKTDTTRHHLAGASILGLLLILGCSPSPDGGPSALLNPVPGEDPVIFLTQNETPDAVPNALFQGRVLADEAGCLRLETADRHTVIWPDGFQLTTAGGDFVVRDAEGEIVGEIGESFGLGGGEVATLHDGIPMDPDERQEARSECPGRYWIVGEVR